MIQQLTLTRGELLGLAACLYHEMGGIELGIYSPTRALNHRTGRRWTTAQWYALLEPHYERMVSPTPLGSAGTLPKELPLPCSLSSTRS